MENLHISVFQVFIPLTALISLVSGLLYSKVVCDSVSIYIIFFLSQFHMYGTEIL